MNVEIQAAPNNCALDPKQNAEINLPDKQNGHTPLHRAVRSGHFDIAILLMSYGASIEVNDRKSKSPVQYCCKPKNYVDAHSKIKEKLVKKRIIC